MIKYNSYSRESQDFFILSVLNKKIGGTYVEIGCGEPIRDSNTFLLESEFDWKGVSIDISLEFKNLFDLHRKNEMLCTDATKINYNDLFSKYAINNHIDFLQIDIDPPLDLAIEVLKKIDFNTFSFSIVSFEHNLYLSGDLYRNESRQILEHHGYKRVLSDVSHNNHLFEDWYVKEEYMPNDNWKRFIGSEINLDPVNLDRKYYSLFEELLNN